LTDLDDDGRVALGFSVRPTSGKLDEDEVAELFLRVVGDADGGDAALDADPFVVFGEIGVAMEIILCDSGAA
jgi:hypothetical protein